jgi:hypothetical protein
MIVQERNRLETATLPLQESIQSHIDYLQQDVERIKEQINDHFDNHPGLKQQRDLLTSIPGIGAFQGVTTTLKLLSSKKFRHQASRKI